MKPNEALAKFSAHMKRARLSRNTQKCYLDYARRFFAASTGGSAEEAVANFLSSFSGHTAATQKQALNALASRNGLYAALDRPLGELPGWVNATRPQRLPTWTTAAETEAILAHLSEPWSSMVGLLFGSGLRIFECMSLRWRDLDFERLTVSIKGGKGDKDRVTVLSRRMIDPLMARRAQCRAIWEEDRAKGRPGVALPDAVRRKSPSAGEDWGMFWVFPAAGQSKDPETGIVRRHHIHPKSFSRPIRTAVQRSGVAKKVTAHAFRHGFATAYLLAGGNLRELQRLMGHAHIETTEIYLHLIPADHDRIGSPWDTPGAAPTIVQFPAQPHRKQA